jgi:KDO2-lipid IV(A) lauroyltransferase
MADPSYNYRPHALASERLYQLRPDGLAWSTPRRTGFVAYSDIEEVRAYKARFFGSSTTYWNFVLRARSGGTVRLGAGNRVGLNSVEDRTSAYMPFIKELEARIAAANPDVRIASGGHWLVHLETVAGWIVVGLARVLRRISLQRSANISAWCMRKIGPSLRGHRRAAEQVAIAFPEKSRAEIETILTGMWDSLGRTGAEYLHLDRIWDFDLSQPTRQGRIVIGERTIGHCRTLLARKGPVLFFGAHIGAWEISALAAVLLAPDITVIYKAPRIKPVADIIERLRSSSNATLLSADAKTALRIRDALKRGHIVGMLVDEFFAGGIDVTMFNRPFKINPLFGRFARIFDCPIYGFYAFRLPDGRIEVGLTDPLEAPRDADGRVDADATMQAVVTVIEGWIRSHPDQMLWLHRRWR